MKKTLIAVGILGIIVVIGFFALVKKDAGFMPGWETYVNEAYGYQISYPVNAVKVNIASNTLQRELTELEKTDPFVVLLDKDDTADEVSTIVISVYMEKGQVAKIIDVETIQSYYQTVIIPDILREAQDLGEPLSEDDFTFRNGTFSGKEAVIVGSPVETVFLLVNDQNQGIIISLPHSDDSINESPNKRKNTERVLSSFKFK